MSSALWLLLYLAPLLGLTAALFAWFGWQWRGSDLRKQVKELQDEAEKTRVAHEECSAELEQLQGELSASREKVNWHEEEAAKARESLHALETEARRLLRDLEALRAESDQKSAKLEAAHAELEQLRSQPAPAVTTSEETPAPVPAATPA
jgi:chromosome segregation ATPase